MAGTYPCIAIIETTIGRRKDKQRVTATEVYLEVTSDFRAKDDASYNGLRYAEARPQLVQPRGVSRRSSRTVTFLMA